MKKLYRPIMAALALFLILGPGAPLFARPAAEQDYTGNPPPAQRQGDQVQVAPAPAAPGQSATPGGTAPSGGALQSGNAASAASTYELILLHSNDHHGVILPNNGRGGLAEIASYVKGIRDLGKNVLLLDAGDINTGSALSNMFSAEPDIKAYGLMGYDAVALGNHEFDGSLKKLQDQMGEASFPFLCANIKKADGSYLAKPYLVKSYQGFKVGIFGLTTRRTQIIASPDKSLSFINEVEAAQEMIKLLRGQEKVDLVIALTHMGDVKEDPDHIVSPELARDAPGIDIIVDGHSHSFMDKPLLAMNTYIVSANEWGKYLGQALVTIRQGKVAGFTWAPVAIGPDEDVNKMLKPYLEKAQASLEEEIGAAEADFVFGNRLTRYQETALGDMVCDSNVWFFRNAGQQLDFAFQNGGGIRAALPKGPITRGSILTVLPFENYLYLVSLKGSDVIELFNFIATIKQGAGAFAQVSKEVRYTIDYSSGTGQLKDLTIGGAPVDPNKTYRFCTNDYIVKGGDGYTVMKKAENPLNSSLLLSYVVTEYIKAQNGIIVPATDGRITVIGGVDM